MCKRRSDGTFLPLSLNSEQEIIAANLFKDIKLGGFPYLKIKDDEHYIGVIDVLYNSDKKLLGDCFNYSRIGVDISSVFCPQIFSMPAKGSFSPLQIFNDDDMLLDCIKRTVKFAKTQTIASVRQGLKTYRKNRCVTVFSPEWAKTIISRLKQGEKNLSVLDFSCGFGGRLIGSYATGMVSEYMGIDPLGKNIESVTKIYRLIQKHASLRNIEFNAEFICGTAEDYLPLIDRNFDVIITSPPYFGKEIYSLDPSQCYIKYSKYEEWKEKWLRRVLELSYRKLKTGGFMIIFASNYDRYLVGYDCRDIMRNLSGVEPMVFKFYLPSFEYMRKAETKKFDTAWVIPFRT